MNSGHFKFRIFFVCYKCAFINNAVTTIKASGIFKCVFFLIKIAFYSIILAYGMIDIVMKKSIICFPSALVNSKKDKSSIFAIKIVQV
jgi:hypothetical protein